MRISALYYAKLNKTFMCKHNNTAKNNIKERKANTM